MLYNIEELNKIFTDKMKNHFDLFTFDVPNALKKKNKEKNDKIIIKEEKNDEITQSQNDLEIQDIKNFQKDKKDSNIISTKKSITERKNEFKNLIKRIRWKYINVFLKIFFVFATILTIKAYYCDCKSSAWENYLSIWIWNYVDVAAIFENIHNLVLYLAGISKIPCKKAIFSNIPGIISCSFMVWATTESIIFQDDKSKSFISKMSFAGAMFGNMAAPFTELIYNIWYMKGKEKIWSNDKSFQHQWIYLSIEW